MNESPGNMETLRTILLVCNIPQFLFHMECVSACECDGNLPIQVCNASTKFSSMYHVITVIKRFSAKAEINNAISNCQIVKLPEHRQKTTLMGLNELCCMSKQITWNN